MPTESETIARLVELVAQLAREREEPQRLLDAFKRGEITSEKLVNELAERYQLGIGSTVRALAEHHPGTAQTLGERLRQRIESALAEVSAVGSERRKPEAPDDPERSSSAAAASFSNRDDDKVLIREYVLVSVLAHSNSAIRTADLIKAVREHESGVKDETITAHLIRLLNLNVIGKERKGRYHGIPQTRSHLAELTREIEARGLELPPRAAVRD